MNTLDLNGNGIDDDSNACPNTVRPLILRGLDVARSGSMNSREIVASQLVIEQRGITTIGHIRGIDASFS